MTDFVDKYINKTFAIVFGVIFTLVITLGAFVSYSYKRRTLALFNVTLLLLVIFAFLRISRALIDNRKNISTKIGNMNIDKFVKYTVIGLFVFHMIMLAVTGVVSVTDAARVAEDANMIASGDVSNLDNDYFSTYPNNLLITLIQSAILKFNNSIGLFENGLVLIVIINSIICIATIVMLYSIIKRFLGEKYALVGFLIGVVSFGISPWVLTSYSDPMGLLFPTLLLYIYLLKPETNYGIVLKFVGLILISSVGYAVKPQTYVMFIAIVAIEGVRLFRTRKILLTIPLIVSSLFCLSTAQSSVIAVAENVGYEIDDNKTFSIVHWFMMGLNDEYDGGYAHEDYEFSSSFDNTEDRNKANMEEAIDRLGEMGVSGTTVHMVKKLLMNFNDGTFSLYMVIVGELSVVGVLLMFLQHSIWILILGMCFISAADKYKGDKYKEFDDDTRKFKSIIMLSIIGLTMFVMLFEGRARYLYTFAPIFAIAATFGVKVVFERLKIDNQIPEKYRKPKIGSTVGISSAVITIIGAIIFVVVFINYYLEGIVVDIVYENPKYLNYGTISELVSFLEIIVIILAALLIIYNIVVLTITLLYMRNGNYKKVAGVLNIIALSPLNIGAGMLILESDK